MPEIELNLTIATLF